MWLLRTRLIIVWLVEQEICRELLVLIAGKVGLDRLVLRKAKSHKPLNRIALLLSHRDLMSSRGERGIIVATCLAKKGEELLGVLRDELGKLWVASAELCEDRLQHLRLLLDDLAQLLELGIVTQEIEVAQALLTAGGSSCDGSSRIRLSTTRTSTGSRALSGSEVKEVDWTIVTTGRWGGGSRGRSRGGLTSRGRLFNVVGNTL